MQESQQLPVLKFTPVFKSVIWGGKRIAEFKGLPSQGDHVGESWELSPMKGNESVVAEGPFKGSTLPEMMQRYGKEIMGARLFEKYGTKFPLLVKFIDSTDDLSIQVHPDDALAKERHDSLGKTEMWYSVNPADDAYLYAAFKEKITPDEFRAKVADNTIVDVLGKFYPKKGDVFFLPAGRVHSIGRGNFVLEIQEASDITYRIYDYDRRDAQGNPRELHTEQAKDAIDYTFHEEYKSAPADPSVADAVIAECGHFKVDRLLLDVEMKLAYDVSSFTVLMCLEGECTVEYADGSMPMKRGETLLLPAVLTDFTLKGKATLLTARS